MKKQNQKKVPVTKPAKTPQPPAASAENSENPDMAGVEENSSNPDKLAHQKEDPKSGNIGKNNAGGYE